MLSVILVPIICGLLIVALYLLLSPRRKEDAPAAAQFQLKSALKLIAEKKDKLSKKDFKKLDHLVNKARSYIERAKFEDIYDMTVPLASALGAREITQSLLLAMPEPCRDYLKIVVEYLTSATDFIATYCGVNGSGTGKMNLSSFSRKAKENKAKAHLESLKKNFKE